MNRVKKLLQSYTSFISTPWRDDAAAAQRVIFCVYSEHEELRMRAKFDEFELATRSSGHDWRRFDLTNTFATWLSNQRYSSRYFQKPDLLNVKLHQYRNFILDSIRAEHSSVLSDKSAVFAVSGVGSVFGFLKVKDLVDSLAPMVSGRLVVFFPGSYDKENNYRLLDAYDGWNYLATPITDSREY